ncbi:MAG: hypothetical protein WC694_01330 [Candidatus Paceibacterota bacterium]|jgi:hypothetical protein
MKTETKQCQNCKENFVIEQEDFNFYEKIKVPTPTFCPLCRAQRRFVFRNERKLFKIKDAFTGKNIFSLFPAESGRKVITQEEWYGDSWDAMEYGRDYDFSKTFFEQFFELEKKVPIYNLNVQRMINSPYSGNATALKNCYLCFHSNYSEDCMYGSANDFCRDCVDTSHIQHSERCYESFWLNKCYQCYFTIKSEDSRNLYFCRDCVGCNDCFGCANLRKSSYCIFNKQYTKEEYQKELEKMKLETISGTKEAREKVRVFWNTQPIKNHQGLKNLNSTGSFVTNCKNVNDGYLIREGENMRYCQSMQVPANKDCYDTFAWGENTELSYETAICGENSYNMKFSFNCWPTCRDSEYCMDLFSCSDCFGCVGLKKKQYCIFNKQFTKEEYQKIVGKIKEQMDEVPYVDKQGVIYKYGEFFPAEFSQLGYNNTVAPQHFPLTKVEAEKKGYLWVEAPQSEYKMTIKSSELPTSIPEEDEILKEIIECENCKKAYRIMENELIFLRKEKLPLPNLCHDCRYDRRIKDRLTIKLYERSCMCAGAKDETGIYKNTVKHLHGGEPCREKFKTGYAPENKEVVYCEKCYQQEVY